MSEARSRKPEARIERPTSSPYVAALTLLARRELSEAQVRQRLARKGYENGEIDEALTRLKDERAIDDQRVAEAIARTEITLKRRGRLRVRRRIEQAGIAPATARHATDSAFAELDPGALLEAALHKRLRGRETIADDREHQRLYRYLIAQGYESDQVIRTLSRFRRR